LGQVNPLKFNINTLYIGANKFNIKATS